MAGSGIRGQFEEKFKALLRDIEEESGKVICFIDEVRKYFQNKVISNSIGDTDLLSRHSFQPWESRRQH